MSDSLMFPTFKMKSSANVWLTNALFIETALHGTDNVIFTLKDKNSPEGYQSFPNIYFALTDKDPTEFTFATTVLGSWEHWEAMCRSIKLKPYIAKLRAELNIRQKSKAVQYMLNEVETDGKNSFQAAKLLLAKPWEDAPVAMTAAERKAKRESNRSEDRKVLSAFADDAERLGLTPNSKQGLN